jgi:predicted DsbA family dithiol-disulfide isomerase
MAHGINFVWEGTTGNTRDSHKLILMAKEKDTLLAQQRLTGYPSSSQGPREPTDTHRTNPVAEEGAASKPRRSSRDRGEVVSEASTASSRTMSPLSQTPSNSKPRNSSWQNITIAAIFQGAFENGRDVSDRAFLAELAVSTGLVSDRAEATSWMDSSVADALVSEGMTRAREIGITAVPSFLIQGKYRVGGYQRPDVFVDLFEEIRSLYERKDAEEGAQEKTSVDMEL